MSKSSLKRLAVAAISLAVIAPSMAPAQAAGEIKIGVITSTSGPLASYGVAYNEGLTWGLNYYTGGKMAINGKKLVVTSKDDGADPASATASSSSAAAAAGVCVPHAARHRRAAPCEKSCRLRG